MDSIADQDVLVDLLLRWEEAQAAGQSLSPQDICKDYPHLLTKFNERLQLLKKVNWITKATDTPEQNDTQELPSCIVDPSTMSTHPYWGRYRIDEFLGKGTYGEVWKAWDAELNRPVAIKLPQQNSQQAHQHFIEEARRIARLNHPGIVKVHDVGVDHDAVYLVCEFVEGKSLAAQPHVEVKANDIPQVISRFVMIADALRHAHEQGVVHGDIKESNILIDTKGVPKLTDFGISDICESLAGEAGHVIRGTPIYMAPELLKGQEANHTPSTDIYSLGVVLYQALTGRFPHEFKTLYQFMKERASITSIRKQNPAVTTCLEQVCLKALADSPVARFASAREFADALGRCQGTRTWRHGLTYVALFLFLLFLAGTLAMAFIPTDAKPVLSKKTDLVKTLKVNTDATVKVFKYQKLEGHKDLIGSLIFLDDSTLLSASYDKRVLLWDIASGRVIREIPGLINHGSHTLLLNSSKTIMYAGSVGPNGESEFCEYEYPSCTKLRTLPFGARDVRLQLAISPDDRYLAAIGSGSVGVWDLATGKRTIQITDAGEPRGIHLTAENQLLVGYKIDELKIFDVKKGNQVETVAGPFSIRSITHIGKEKEYVSVGNYGYWMLFNLGNSPIKCTKIQPRDVGDRQFRVVGLGTDHMLIGYQSGLVRLWNVRSQAVRSSFHGHTTTVHSLAVSPDKKHFVSGDDRGNLLLWKMPDEGLETRPLQSQ
ncbi:MAG: serine/threonine-protein kinase [Gemmatales bacterium]